MVNKDGGAVIQAGPIRPYLIAAFAAGAAFPIAKGKSMIFWTESHSAGVADAPAARIVKAAVEATRVALAGLFSVRGRRATLTLTLSDHELRDIGLEPGSPGAPIAYDLLDLAPRRTHLSHRALR